MKNQEKKSNGKIRLSLSKRISKKVETSSEVKRPEAAREL